MLLFWFSPFKIYNTNIYLFSFATTFLGMWRNFANTSALTLRTKQAQEKHTNLSFISRAYRKILGLDQAWAKRLSLISDRSWISKRVRFFQEKEQMDSKKLGLGLAHFSVNAPPLKSFWPSTMKIAIFCHIVPGESNSSVKTWQVLFPPNQNTWH